MYLEMVVDSIRWDKYHNLLIVYFDCLDNKLTSLIGCPTEVGRDFNCEYNNKEFTENDVKSLCKVGGSIYV